MNQLFNPEISILPNIQATVPRKVISLHELIERIKDGTYAQAIAAVRRYLPHDQEGYTRYKPQLPYVLPAGIFSERKNDGITEAVGLAIFDLDMPNKDPAHLPQMGDLRDAISREPFVAAAYVSPSGAGLKVFVRIYPTTDLDAYKEQFAEIAEYLGKTYPSVATDKRSSDICRACFISHDPQAFYNPHVSLFPGLEFAGRFQPLAGELWDMADGERHHTRNRVAHTVGGLIGGGIVSQELVESYFTPIIEATTAHPDKALKEFFGRQLKGGIAKPITERTTPSRYSPSFTGSEPPATDGTLKLPQGTYGDVYNASGLLINYGHILKYCREWGAWQLWSGTHWIIDRQDEVFDYARDILTQIGHYALHEEDEKLVKHIMRSRSHRNLCSMLAQAGTMHGIRSKVEDFDAHPWLFNCANGTLDLRSGRLDPHQAQQLITKCAPVDFDPHAQAPQWLHFLRQIMGADDTPDSPDDTAADLERKADAEKKAQGLITFLQRAVGYSLVGSTQEKVLFIPWGTGDNGKSTFIETLADVLGTDYALHTPPELFLSREKTAIPNDVARLKGVRFAYASEPPTGRRLNASLIKELTGGDTVSARYMRGEFFDFRPECTLWMSTNHRPPTRDTGHALWNRIKLIPFTQTIPKDQQIKDLRARLVAEAPGILAWAVQGCLDWQRDGLQESEEVKAATDAYRQENDSVQGFLNEVCSVLDGVQAKLSSLYEEYKKWADTSGENILPLRVFSSALKEKGFQSYTNNGTWFRGVGIRQVNN